MSPLTSTPRIRKMSPKNQCFILSFFFNFLIFVNFNLRALVPRFSFAFASYGILALTRPLMVVLTAAKRLFT